MFRWDGPVFLSSIPASGNQAIYERRTRDDFRWDRRPYSRWGSGTATGYVVSRHKDGSIRKSFFCEIYQLQHGKINSIKSYMVFENPDK